MGNDGPNRDLRNVNVKNLIHRSFTFTIIKDNYMKLNKIAVLLLEHYFALKSILSS